MSPALGLLIVFGAALAAWVATLALFWRVFRSWQYLMDAMERCPADILRRSAWPVTSPYGPHEIDDIPVTQRMGLQARVFIFDLPDAPACPADARGHARVFRRAVLGAVVLMSGILVTVAALEPVFATVARVIFALIVAFALLNVAMMIRWGLWPGQKAADA